MWHIMNKDGQHRSLWWRIDTQEEAEAEMRSLYTGDEIEAQGLHVVDHTDDDDLIDWRECAEEDVNSEGIAGLGAGWALKTYKIWSVNIDFFFHRNDDEDGEALVIKISNDTVGAVPPDKRDEYLVRYFEVILERELNDDESLALDIASERIKDWEYIEDIVF